MVSEHLVKGVKSRGCAAGTACCMNSVFSSLGFRSRLVPSLIVRIKCCLLPLPSWNRKLAANASSGPAR